MSSEAADGLGEERDEDPGSVRGLAKRFIAEFKDDDLTGTAAEIAYHMIFAIPPLIILIVMAAALLNQYANVAIVSSLHNLVDQRAPADVKPVLDSVIDNAVGKVSGGVASIGAIVTAAIALWSGSNAIGTFMKAFNQAHDVEEARPLLKKKLLALGLTLALIIAIIVAFTLFVFGQETGVWVADQVGLGNAFSTAWNIGRWPVAIVFIMFLLSLLYYLGPNVDQRFHWVSVGSVVATLLWIGAVFGFKLYLTLSNPGSVYGAFGGIVVLLFFLYISGLVFLIGAELNAVIEHRFEQEMAGSPVTRSTPVDGGTARRSARAEAVHNRTGPEPNDATSTMLASHATPKEEDETSNGLVGHQDRRTAGALITGFTVAGVAGALGWLAWRRGSRIN